MTSTTIKGNEPTWVTKEGTRISRFTSTNKDQWILGLDEQFAYITGSDIGWETIKVERNTLEALNQPFISLVCNANETEWIVSTLADWKNA